MSLTVSGLNNIALVASGEKDIKNASIDTFKDTSGSFISVVGIDLMQKAISEVVNQGSNKEIFRLLGNGLPIAEIAAGVMIGNSVIRYINYEISIEECVSEVIVNGAGVIAYTLGMAFGGPAGAIVSSMIMAQISNTVLEYREMIRYSKEKTAKLNSIVAQALIEMEYQRNYLKNVITSKFAYWDKQINKGFEEIFSAAFTKDSDGIANGLHKILGVFGEHVKFKTQDDFDKFFFNEDSALVL